MERENENPLNKRNSSNKDQAGTSNIDHVALKLVKEYSNEKGLAKRMAILEKGFKIQPNNLGLVRFIAWKYVFNALYDQAMNYFRRVLEMEGPSPDTHCGIGAVKFLQENFSSALKNLKSALDAGLDNWEVHYYLGVTYEKLGQDQPALDHLVKAAARNCPAPYCYIFLGRRFIKSERYAQAKKYLLKLQVFEPNSAESHMYLGLIYSQERKWDLAIAGLRKSLQLGADFPNLRCLLGEAYVHKGLHRKAKGEFQTMNKMDPRDPRGYVRLSLISVDEEQWDKAEKFLKKARDRGLRDSDWYANLALICEGKELIDDAIKYYKAALEDDPNNALANIQLGNIYRERNDTSDAIPHLEKAFQLMPHDLSTAFSLGEIYAVQGKLKECNRCVRRIVSLDTKSALAPFLLSTYYAIQGDLNRARKYGEKTIRLNDNLAEGHYLLYRIYSMQKDFKRAPNCLEKSIGLGADVRVIDYMFLAEHYYFDKKYRQAKPYFEKAIKMDPKCGEAYLFLGIISAVEESNHRLALSMFELSEKHSWRFSAKEKARRSLDHSRNLSMAMVNWQNGEFDSARRYWLKCAQISTSANLPDRAREEQYLSLIVSFDENLQELGSASNLDTMRLDLALLSEAQTDLLKAIKKQDKKQRLLATWIGWAKGEVVQVILGILTGRGLDEVQRQILEEAKRPLEYLKMVKSAVIFDLIEVFAFDFSNAKAQFGSLDKIPKETADSLLDSLKEILKHLGGRMSVEGIGGKYWTTLEPYLKDIQTQMSSVRAISEDTNRLVKSRSGPLRVGATAYEEQKEKRVPREPSIGVYLSRTKIQLVDGKLQRAHAKTYPWRLLELLLQRQRIHWTYGFLIFDKWRGDPGPDNPKKTINSYIATLKGKTEDSLSHNKIPIEIEKDTETGEVYLKEYDRSKLFSNIFSAEERANKVEDILAKGGSEALEDAKKSLVDIIDGKEGYYNCYEAYKLLIHYFEKTGFRKEDERIITMVAEFFEEKMLVYGESFHAIEAHRERIPQTYYWKGTDEAVDIMREELRELEEYYKIIAPRAAKKRVSEDFSDIIRLIGKVKNLKPPYELLLEEKAFEELARKHSIRSMLNSVSLQIPKDKRLKNLSREDIELSIFPNFARVITRVRTRHFQSLPPLIKYLKTSTEQRTREELIEREYEIPTNIQRDIRRKSKIQKNLIQKPGHKVKDDEVYKKLGWSKEKQREIRMHESKLWKVPGFNEQQYKDEMP